MTEFLIDQSVNKVAAPALPVPPAEYSRGYSDQLNKVLRLYFNQLDVSLRGILSTTAPSNLKFVSSKADLPAPVSGVITLLAGYAYFFTADVDLTGDRLVLGGVTTILGTSSETASITSTGLGASTPLITANYTLAMNGITIKDVGTGVLIDDNAGAGAPLALDWDGVNFSNVDNVGEIGDIDNFVFSTGSFLSAQNLRFTGDVGTIAINNSLLSGDGTAKPLIDVTATAVVSRRFRVIYSSLVAVSPATAITVNASATIPIEGFILDTCNFSGGGTYLGGLTFTSESALFVANKGITNSTAIAQMYMKNNATATTVSVTNDRYAMAGTTEFSSDSQKFSHVLARNSIRYDSTIPRLFRVIVTFSLTSTSNNVIGVYIGRTLAGNSQVPDTDRISESEVYVTTSGTRPDAGAVQALVTLNEDDELYVIVQNTSAANNITVSFANMIAERTN